MAKLKRDERVCPFCAENIKASAIRCRFCQSDVTPTSGNESRTGRQAEPDTDPDPDPDPDLDPDPEIEEPVDSVDEAVPVPRDDRPFVQRWLTLVLATLILLAGAGVGTLWWRAEHGSSAAASDGALVGDEARTEVLVTAADLAQRALSYSYKSLANDMEVARARMTPAFRKEYDATMAQVRANTKKNKITLQGVVVSSAIIEATEHRAKVLVFLNQTTTAGEGKKANEQLNRNSLVITLTRGDGDWDMSKLTALG